MDIKDVMTAYLGDLEYNASSLSRMNHATDGTQYFDTEALEMLQYIEGVKSLIKTLEYMMRKWGDES
jgi:hypothetical protein